MLQTSSISTHKEAIIKALKKRNIDAEKLVNDVIDLDESRRSLQFELDNTLFESNKISKQIGSFITSGNPEQATALKKQNLSLKESSKKLQDKLSKVSNSLTQALYQIPNVPHPDVPEGRESDDNECILQEGDMNPISEEALPHWELVKKYDIIDFELGNKISGAGFPVYKSKGARLQRALINYFLDHNTAAGYTEYQPPLLINEASGYGTGQLPDKEGQMYHTALDNLYLIPTAEVPVTNFFRDQILLESDLPIKCTAYTPCFRREAGSYGSHVRGLNRLHQFDKVEIVQIQHPDNSYKALEEMVIHIKKLLVSLGLPFRILRLCGGDLGFTSALTYDFEVFSKAQKKWLEVSSVSNFETFQANRLNLRFKNKTKKTSLAHTLNGSSLALPRIIAALLENYQGPKGIAIPEILIPYTGFSVIN